jgi:acetyl-CoA carboxylase biotin carboxyl carrier protein
VADEANSPNPFDVEIVEKLVALMSQHDLSEIDLRHGPARIRLLRGAQVVTTVAAAPVASALPQATPIQAPAQSAAPAPAATKYHQIKSPTPGTFYDREKPDAAPYVNVGSRVTPSIVVGLIEAMKLFNEIQAECSGVIVRRLVENGQPVEFDQALFEVDMAG